MKCRQDGASNFITNTQQMSITKNKHDRYTISCHRIFTRKINTKEQALFQASKVGIGGFSDCITAEYRV